MAEGGEAWIPQTSLGRAVLEGKITSIDQIFSEALRIREPEIVDYLLPNLQQEILDVTLVQKQTDAGERTAFRALVAVGNGDGYIGLGHAKASQVRQAIEKATREAKLHVIPVRRGCGSWECGCDQPHSLPLKVRGKCGSVRVNLIPAPRGTGLVAADVIKPILRLAGIKDCWTLTFGSTRTALSFCYATFDALRNTHRYSPPPS